MAGKPVVKLYGKKKRDADAELPEYIDIAAFWTNDDGKLGGMWSRDIVAIKMKDRDGNPYVVTAEQLKTYFCNLRDDREPSPPPSRRETRDKAKHADEPPPDFGDDDIPF